MIGIYLGYSIYTILYRFQMSQTGPDSEPEPDRDVASTSRTEQEPSRPMPDRPGSEPSPSGLAQDRTSPSRTEREPDTLQTRSEPAPPTRDRAVKLSSSPGPEPDDPWSLQCSSDVLGLPSGRRQPARTRDSVPTVLPIGPRLRWILNEPSRASRRAH